MGYAKVILSLCVLFVFSGCMSSSSYSQANVGQIEDIKYGTIIEARATQIGDDGVGTVLGAIAGGVIGSQIGGGKNTKKLATVGGAIAGGVAGNNLNNSPGQELLIRTDDGNEFSTIYKISQEASFSFRAGDRVRVYSRGGKISRIAISN